MSLDFGMKADTGSAAALTVPDENAARLVIDEVSPEGHEDAEVASKTRDTAATGWRMWSAVGSMALCVALLIASEFMPVSLLTPIAADLGATAGMAGQAISISGLFAVGTSLFIATIAGRADRRHLLMGLTGLMLASLILIAKQRTSPC